MLDNCFRFAPRDSIPGLIAKICKYLKDHPGWSEDELEEQIKKFISATGVESFNGRTGNVTLDKNDVNNLKIASAYFAEGDESIDSLDLVSLYNQGVRFVFTDFNSVTSGYNLAFVLDYFDASGEVVYYPVSTGSGSGGNIVSVNGKTGAVHLKVVDVSNGNSPDENAYIFIDESDDYPDVISSDSSKLGGQLPSYYASAEDVSKINDYIDSKPQFGDPYDGVDLAVKHAEEIEDYASPWSWIKARIAAGNFSRLHVGDYIPFTTTNGKTFQAQIAGINTYKGYGDTEVGNHIDFITRELWPNTFKMNLVNFNNGTYDTKQTPWLASNGYLFVNSLASQVPNGTTLPLDMVDKDYTAGGMYFYLPDDLKAVIVEKRIYAQTRYSASGVLTNDNGGAWVNLGKLWLPDEYEVTGARLMTTTGWFCGGYVQYPIFVGNMNRLKRANGRRYHWWLSSALVGNSTRFVDVTGAGQVNYNNASVEARAPFCFRVS